MAVKVTDFQLLNAGLWGLLAVLQLMDFNVRYPLPSYVAIGLAVSGVSFGFGLGVVTASRWLRSLEKKGEFRESLAGVLIAVGVGLIVFAVFLLFAFQTSNVTFTVFFDFAGPLLPVLFATEAFLCRRWEWKHRKRLWQGILGGRIYVRPYP